MLSNQFAPFRVKGAVTIQAQASIDSPTSGERIHREAMESPLRRLGKIEPQCEQKFSIPNHEKRWLHLPSRSIISGYCIFVLPVPGYFFNKFKRRFKRGLTQDFLKDRISEMGGVVYEKENTENIMKSHSKILNFYVFVKDEEDLINATGDKYQLEAMRTKLKLHRHCTASELSTDAESREDAKCSTKKKLSPAALACKRFASGGFMFITVD